MQKLDYSPYPFTEDEIKKNAKKQQSGVFGLGNLKPNQDFEILKTEHTQSVPDALRTALKKKENKDYTFFGFSYTENEKDAFELACKFYHERPPIRDNDKHPIPEDKCEICHPPPVTMQW